MYHGVHSQGDCLLRDVEKWCSGAIGSPAIVYCTSSSSFLAKCASFTSSAALFLMFLMGIVLLLVTGQFTKEAGRGTSAGIDSLLSAPGGGRPGLGMG